MARKWSVSQNKFVGGTTGGGQTGGQVSGQTGGDTRSKLQQVALMDLLTTGGKNVSKINAVLGMFPEPKEEEDVANKIRTGADAKVIAAAKSGLASSKRIRGELTKEGKTGLRGTWDLFGSTTGGTPWGKGLEGDILNVADAVLRARSGAAAPEAEVKRFAKVIAPMFFQAPKTRERKLSGAETELRTILSEMGEIGEWEIVQ